MFNYFFIIISRILDSSTQIWHGTLHICCQRKTSVNGFEEFELEILKKTYMYLYPLIDWNKTIVSPSYVCQVQRNNCSWKRF